MKGGFFLSDGRFFKMYEPLALHMLISYSGDSSRITNMFTLIAAASEIDDKQATLSDLVHFKMEDTVKMLALYNK